MGRFSRGALAFSGAVVFLMLLRDGSLPKLINDAASGARDLTAGIKPLTKIA